MHQILLHLLMAPLQEHFPKRAVALIAAACSLGWAGPSATVQDTPIPYPASRLEAVAMSHMGSTHELAFDLRNGALWITRQQGDVLVRRGADGAFSFFPLPKGSGPHGIAFDAAGRLWVGLEYAGEVVRLDARGRIVARYDVRLDCRGCSEKINPHPHGLTVGPDGRTIWFTGKATGTVGRITPDGQVRTSPLQTVGSVPIYIAAGADGNLW